MAGGAFAATGTLGELSLVGVRLVTIHAFFESQRFFEISACVALGTFHAGMLSQKRILGCRVIEAFADCLRRYFFPSAGVVTRLAALCKASAMRIRVTIGALAEWDSGVARFIVLSGRMTFLAGDLCVQPSQRIAGLGMIKLPNADSLPIAVGMALETVVAQPPLVLVLVAGEAVRRDTKECLIQIFDLDYHALRRRDMFSTVAAIAGQPRMFAFE